MSRAFASGYPLHRPYRAGLQRERVLLVIEQGAGSHFDPAIVAACLEVMAV
jgi:HD-GYP domain-containing protein (c-di-GMP phosphodiesterase class II)